MECCINKLTGKRQECRRGFPAPFLETTTICPKTGRVSYRRRDTGRSWAKKIGDGHYKFSNADVVPYCPKLMLK
jgi:hypothetical protein